VIDGEAIVRGVDGYSDFNALHSGKHNAEVQFCAFDVLTMDGEDLCNLPLCVCTENLIRVDDVTESPSDGRWKRGNRARDPPKG
jgi:hypothetical protein